MLTEKTSKQLKLAGFSIKKAQEAFVTACNAAMVEIAGKGWKRKKDIESIFHKLETEIRVPLCIDDDGPQFDAATFRSYFSRARKCMVFGVPFSMAHNVTIDNCAKVKAKVVKDRRKIDKQTKVHDALRQVRAENRLERQNTEELGFIRIPRPGDKPGSEWLELFKTAVREALAYPQVKALIRRHPDIGALSDILSGPSSKGQSPKNSTSSRE